MDDMRKAFEAWWLEYEKNSGEERPMSEVIFAWHAWQAATMAERERVEPEMDWAAQNLLAFSSDCGREWTKEVDEFLATCRGN